MVVLGESTVVGWGLHSGAPVRVVLRARPGPVTVGVGGLEARIDELTVASTVRATTVVAHGGALRVATIEHVFAALAGLGVYEGVALVLEGPEMPLLDGGASAWCDAIGRLGLPAAPPPVRVARHAVLDVGESRYEFTPGPRVEIEVRLVLDGIAEGTVAPEARWGGDAVDFRARIAPARTFALARDVDELAALGLARHVDPAAVVVITPGRIHHVGLPFTPDEPARHKLLDLVGDLYLGGGPPAGRVRALRPGHAANAEALRRARAEGIMRPTE